MKVRSLSLAVVGLMMIVLAASLGVLLVHDGEVQRASLATVLPGDVIQVKGEPAPFFPDNLALWAPLRPLLANYTFQVTPEPGVVVLLTSGTPIPVDMVLAEGTVAFVGAYPGFQEAQLVIVQVASWREPLLFR